jgi:hypothetical protein
VADLGDDLGMLGLEHGRIGTHRDVGGAGTAEQPAEREPDQQADDQDDDEIHSVSVATTTDIFVQTCRGAPNWSCGTMAAWTTP